MWWKVSAEGTRRIPHVGAVLAALAIRGGVVALATFSAPAVHAEDEAWRAAQAAADACFDAADRDSILAGINAKFPRRSAPPKLLFDMTVPDESEAEALRLRMAKEKPCREQQLAMVRARYPDLEPAYRIFFYQADQVNDYLQQGAITYGTANRLSAAAYMVVGGRELLFFDATPAMRLMMGDRWRDRLARGHSNPPPTPDLMCDWQDSLNIVCEPLESPAAR